MISIQDIINAPGIEVPTESEFIPSLEDLEKTAEDLKKIASPDREEDRMVKEAVIQDLIKEAFWRSAAGKTVRTSGKLVRETEKELAAAANALKAAKNKKAAEDLLSKAEKVESGAAEATSNSSKLVGAGAVGAAGMYLAMKNKKAEA